MKTYFCTAIKVDSVNPDERNTDFLMCKHLVELNAIPNNTIPLFIKGEDLTYSSVSIVSIAYANNPNIILSLYEYKDVLLSAVIGKMSKAFIFQTSDDFTPDEEFLDVLDICLRLVPNKIED